MRLLLSPSSVVLFSKCPYAFYLHKIKNIPPIQPYHREAVEFGRNVHQIIAKYYELIPESMTSSQIYIYLAKAIKEVVGYVDERLQRQMEGFAKFEKQRLGWSFSVKPVAIEKEYVKPPLKGIVDAVFRRGDKLVVVDWKSGYTGRITNEMAIQGMIYKYLTGADEVYFVFLQYGYVQKLPNYDMKWLVDQLKKIGEAVDSNRFPKNKENCETCEYQLYCKFEELGWTVWDA